MLRDDDSASVYLHVTLHPVRNNDVIVTETRTVEIPINVSTGVHLIYRSTCDQNKQSVPGLRISVAFPGR